jgi:hypothetical protein
MITIAAAKSPQQNRLEGFALTAMLQGFPTYATASLVLKLMGAHEIVGERWGAALFVALASIFHAMFVPWVGPKFPKLFKQSYEPLFYDLNLSFSEKIAQWRAQPMVSVQLVASMLMLSLLAVGVASIR